MTAFPPSGEKRPRTIFKESYSVPGDGATREERFDLYNVTYFSGVYGDITSDGEFAKLEIDYGDGYTTIYDTENNPPKSYNPDDEDIYGLRFTSRSNKSTTHTVDIIGGVPFKS